MLAMMILRQSILMLKKLHFEFYTMKDLFNIIKDDGLAATKEYINGNEMVK